MRQQSGFTLVELVMVIVILGILAATAVPRFINLSGDAQQAAVNGIAGALGSASAINYASRSANVANGVAVSNCSAVGGALEGGLPTGYSITDATTTSPTRNCTLTHTASTLTGSFVAHIIP